jgi:hypothetical protein
MTHIGHKATSGAIAEQIRKRHEVRHETTVREEKLPDEVVDNLALFASAVHELQQRVKFLEDHAVADIQIKHLTDKS